MNINLTGLADKKWFVPLLIIVMALVVLSSLIHPESERDTTTETSLEAQLAHMCDSVKGVSNSKVMIYYQVSANASYFSDSGKSADISGVAIVCRGGDDPEVKLRLYDMLTSLFSLKTTNISISGGE